MFLAEEPPRDEWPNPDEFGRLAREDVRGAEVVLRRAASALAGELGQEGGEHFLRYRQYLRALAGTGPSAGSLELMHGQCSSPALQLEDASVYVSHTIAALEGETEVRGAVALPREGKLAGRRRRCCRWHWDSLDRGLSPFLRVIQFPLPRYPSLPLLTYPIPQLAGPRTAAAARPPLPQPPPRHAAPPAGAPADLSRD